MSKLTVYPVNGKYGKYGGKFVPETLISALEELETALFEKVKLYNNLQIEMA